MDEVSAKPKSTKHPERICWGCDNYCAAGDLQCGSRTRHPVELCGEDWEEWSDRLAAAERIDAANPQL